MTSTPAAELSTPDPTHSCHWTKGHLLPLLLAAAVCGGRGRRRAVGCSFDKRRTERACAGARCCFELHPIIQLHLVLKAEHALIYMTNLTNLKPKCTRRKKS